MSNPRNQVVSRYNMRTLRGERVTKKKEGARIKRWESDYQRFINDSRNVLSRVKVMEEIAQAFENSEIEQENVSLICPLTKKRIVVPVRYCNCRHLQCFDLMGFLAMKSKRNFLECPICNTKVDSELTGLRIDKYFQNILSEVSGATEICILRAGTFRVVFPHLAPIIPKIIDDEEPFEPDRLTTLTCEVKSETSSKVNDIEELGSVSSSDIEGEINEINAKTPDVQLLDTFMAGDTNQAVDHSTNIDENKSVTGINVDNVERLDSVSGSHIDGEINERNTETQILHFSDSPMPDDINQPAHSNNAKAGSKIEEKRFKCGDCSYSTKYSGHFLTHRRTHTGERPFKCTKCSYESARANSLKTHMRTHTGEKPYKCSQCSYATTQATHLKTHMLTHTGKKPYKCSQCSFACAQAIHLPIHIRTHTGEKPYKCSQCSYASVQTGHLKSHMLTHTGEKPYKCSQCSFASAHPSDLKKHIRIHTGDKPYKCSQCSYSCADASALKSHMRTHTGEKPYKCDRCSYSCAKSSALKSHMRTHI